MMLTVITAGVLMFSSCQDAAKQEAPSAETLAIVDPAKPDLTKIRKEIQAVEKAWAVAQNAKDIKALMALYTNNAVSMPALLFKHWMYMHREIS